MEGIENRLMQLRSQDLQTAAQLRSEDLAEVQDLRERLLKLEASKYRIVGICSALTFLITTLVVATGPFLTFS